MLVDKTVREAYWIMSYLARFNDFVADKTLKQEMYKTRLFMISRVCGPLVNAGLLLKKKERSVTGYKLAYPPKEIALTSIHRAFDSKWHQEFSPIALFADECLRESTLADLCRYEDVEMKDILFLKLAL